MLGASVGAATNGPAASLGRLLPPLPSKPQVVEAFEWLSDHMHRAIVDCDVVNAKRLLEKSQLISDYLFHQPEGDPLHSHIITARKAWGDTPQNDLVDGDWGNPNTDLVWQMLKTLDDIAPRLGFKNTFQTWYDMRMAIYQAQNTAATANVLRPLLGADETRTAAVPTPDKNPCDALSRLTGEGNDGGLKNIMDIVADQPTQERGAPESSPETSHPTALETDAVNETGDTRSLPSPPVPQPVP